MAGHSKWAGIKHKKAIVDARRGKLFTKLVGETRAYKYPVVDSTGATITTPNTGSSPGILERAGRYQGACTVTFTHGYPECPADLLELLATMAQPLPDGTHPMVSSLASGPHSIRLAAAAAGGAGALTDAQHAVLAPYWLPWA